ncbi:hypothetical protein ALC56_01808, partial [Trachymyrmex septentrionalis]
IMEIDKEVRKYKDVIQVMGMKSLEIQKQIYSLYIKTNALQNQIEALESKNEDHSSQSDSSELSTKSSNVLESSSNESSDESKMCHNDKSIYAAMKEEIRLLEQDLKSKNEMIVMLELQIHTKLLFDEKLKNLHDRLMAHKKVTSLIL